MLVLLRDFMNRGLVPDETRFLQTCIDQGIPSSKEDIISWYHDVFNLNCIANFIESSDVTEIIMHSPPRVQIEKHGTLFSEDILTLEHDKQEAMCELLAYRNGAKWNLKDPFASFYAKIRGENFRVTLTHSALNPHGISKMFLRKIKGDILPLSAFSIGETTSKEIKKFISEKKNILLSGGTGSGKTTFLKSLLGHVPENEHVVIMEDTFELKFSNKNFTNLTSDSEFENRSLKEFCAYSLRMRPDRIVLGEIRSSEIVPFVLNMNTGQRGVIGTIHANSAKDAIDRASLLFSIYGATNGLNYCDIVRLLSKNVDVIIHLENRSVIEIATVLGSENGISYIEEIPIDSKVL